jgi:hypothetical protein
MVFASKNVPQQAIPLTLASVIEEVHRSGSKPKTNSDIVAAVREQFAKRCGDSSFPWNAVLLLRTWKKYE